MPRLLRANGTCKWGRLWGDTLTLPAVVSGITFLLFVLVARRRCSTLFATSQLVLTTFRFAFCANAEVA
eukprot:15002609-Alexandrium_andersonii.AAC.1